MAQLRRVDSVEKSLELKAFSDITSPSELSTMIPSPNFTVSQHCPPPVSRTLPATVGNPIINYYAREEGALSRLSNISFGKSWRFGVVPGEDRVGRELTGWEDHECSLELLEKGKVKTWETEKFTYYSQAECLILLLGLSADMGLNIILTFQHSVLSIPQQLFQRADVQNVIKAQLLRVFLKSAKACCVNNPNNYKI